LNGEGSETLKRYCEVFHKNSTFETPLFPTASGKPINQRYIWIIVKRCLKKAGLNPKNTWTHTIRKAFRRQVAQADVDFEFKEMIMGHMIGGSREAYFDRHNISWFIEQYQKVNFGREAVGSETFKLQKQMEELRRVNIDLKQRLNGIEPDAELLNKMRAKAAEGKLFIMFRGEDKEEDMVEIGAPFIHATEENMRKVAKEATKKGKKAQSES